MRLYYGGYGHNPSGKQYVYWGRDGMNTGQHVVAPVTNPYSHKTYNTMFTIQRTSGADREMSENEAQRLSQSGVGIKSIQGTNVMSLPGAKNYNTAQGWTRASNQRYKEEVNARLSARTQTYDTTQAVTRLLGG